MCVVPFGATHFYFPEKCVVRKNEREGFGWEKKCSYTTKQLTGYTLKAIANTPKVHIRASSNFRAKMRHSLMTGVQSVCANSAKRKEKGDTMNNDNKSSVPMDKGTKIRSIVLIVVFLAFVGFMLYEFIDYANYSKNHNESMHEMNQQLGNSGDSKTCKSCGRSFSDSTNKNYITHTGMCKNCYQNFCWETGKTPTNYDK